MRKATHLTFKQGVSSSHQQAHNKAAVDLISWPPPFVACKSFYTQLYFLFSSQILPSSRSSQFCCAASGMWIDNYKIDIWKLY